MTELLDLPPREVLKQLKEMGLAIAKERFVFDDDGDTLFCVIIVRSADSNEAGVVWDAGCVGCGGESHGGLVR